jgi:hypothetical protein
VISIKGVNVGIGTPNPGYSLTVNGTAWCSNGAWAGSDQRWKKNIQDLQTGTIEKIAKLRAVTYDWRATEYPDLKFSPDHQIGLIAQEVEKEFPALVHTDAQGFKSLSYDKLTAVLVEAVKEQQKIIQRQEGTVKSQQALLGEQGQSIVSLNQRLQKLEKAMLK